MIGFILKLFSRKKEENSSESGPRLRTWTVKEPTRIRTYQEQKYGSSEPSPGGIAVSMTFTQEMATSRQEDFLKRLGCFQPGFTVAQLKSSVEWLKRKAPRGLAWFALSTACGLRPEEAEKTDEKRDINFAEGFIRVEAQTTKIRQRRVVYPKKEAMKFLKWSLKFGGKSPLHPQARRRIIRKLRDVLGFKVWPKDITRHTAASYWLAADESVSHVAEMLGHSERTLKSNYKALVTKKEADEFWKLLVTIAHLKKGGD